MQRAAGSGLGDHLASLDPPIPKRVRPVLASDPSLGPPCHPHRNPLPAASGLHAAARLRPLLAAALTLTESRRPSRREDASSLFLRLPTVIFSGLTAHPLDRRTPKRLTARVRCTGCLSRAVTASRESTVREQRFLGERLAAELAKEPHAAPQQGGGPR